MEQNKEDPDFLNDSLEECLRFEGNVFKKKRSSILKQSKFMSTDICENDTEFRRSQNNRRVSFADTFQVMELHTGNIYDIPGQNESSVDCCEISSSEMDKENLGINFRGKSFKIMSDGIAPTPLTNLALCQQSENIRIKVTETGFVHKEDSCATLKNSLQKSFCVASQYGEGGCAPEVSETVKSLLENSSEENDKSISPLTSTLFGNMYMEKENYIYQTRHVSSEHTICRVSRSSDNVFPENFRPEGFGKVDILEKSFENVLIHNKENVPTKSSLYVIKSNKVENESIAVNKPPFSSLSTVDKHDQKRCEDLNQSNVGNVYGLPKSSSASFVNPSALEKDTIQVNNHKLQTLKENIFEISFLKCAANDTHKELLTHDGTEIFNEEKVKKIMDESINVSKEGTAFINQHLTSCEQNTSMEITHIQETSNLDETNMSLPNMDETCVGTLDKSNYPEPALFPQQMQDFIIANFPPIQKTRATNKQFIGVETINQRSLPRASCDAGGRKTSRRSLNKTKLTLEDMDITCMPDNIVEDFSPEVSTDQVDFGEVIAPVKSEDLYGKHELSGTHFKNKKGSTSRNFDLTCDAEIMPMDMTCVGILNKSNYSEQHMPDFKIANFPQIQQTHVTSKKLTEKKTINQRSLPHVSYDAVEIKKTSRKSEDMDITYMPDSTEDCSPKVNTDHGDFIGLSEAVKSDGKHQLSNAHLKNSNGSTSRNFDLLCNSVWKKPSRKSLNKTKLTVEDMDITCMPENIVEDCSPMVNTDQSDCLDLTKPVKCDDLYGKQQLSIAHFENKISHACKDFKVMTTEHKFSVKDDSKWEKSSSCDYPPLKSTDTNTLFPLHATSSVKVSQSGGLCISVGKVDSAISKNENLGHNSFMGKIFHDCEQKALTCEPTTVNIPSRCELPAHKQNPCSPGRKFMKIVSEFGSPYEHLKSLSHEQKSECSISSIRSIDETNLNESRKRHANNVPCFPSKNFILESTYNPEDPVQRDLPRKRQSQSRLSSCMDITCIADESLADSEVSLNLPTQATGTEASPKSVLKVTVPELCQSNILNTDKTVSNNSYTKTQIFTSNFMDLTSISDSSENGNLIKDIGNESFGNDLKTHHFQSLNMEITCASTTVNKHLADDSQLDTTSKNLMKNHSAENLASECLTKLSNRKCGVPAMSLSTIERDNFYLSNKTHLEGENPRHFTSDPMDITCKSEYAKEIQHTTGVQRISKCENNILDLNDMEITCAVSNNSLSEQASLLNFNDKPSFNDSSLSKKRIPSIEEVNSIVVRKVPALEISHQLLTSKDQSENASADVSESPSFSEPQDLSPKRNGEQNASIEDLVNACQDSKYSNKTSGKRNIKTYGEEEKEDFLVKRTKIATPGVVYRVRKCKQQVLQGLHENIYFSPEINELLKSKQSFGYKQAFNEIEICTPMSYHCKKSRSFSSFVRENSFTEQLKQDQNISYKLLESCKAIEDNPTALSKPCKELSLKKDIPPKIADDIEESFIAKSVCFSEKIDSSHLKVDKGSHLQYEIAAEKSIEGNPSVSTEQYKELNPEEGSPLKSASDITKNIFAEKISNNDSKFDNTQMSHLHYESTIDENNSLQLLPNSILNNSISFCGIDTEKEKGDVSLLVNRTLVPDHASRTVAKASDVDTNLNKDLQIETEKRTFHPVLSSEEAVHTHEPLNITNNEEDQPQEKRPVRKTETENSDMIVSVQPDSIEIQRKGETLENVSLFELPLKMSFMTPSNPSREIQISKPSDTSLDEISMFHQIKDEKKVEGNMLVKPNLTSLSTVVKDAEILQNLNQDVQVEAVKCSYRPALSGEESMQAFEPLSTMTNETNNERDRPHEKKNLPSPSTKTEFVTKTVSVQSDYIENLQTEKAARNVGLSEHSVEPLNTVNNMSVDERNGKKNLLSPSTKQAVQMAEFVTKTVSVQSDSIKNLQTGKAARNVSLSERSVEPLNTENNMSVDERNELCRNKGLLHSPTKHPVVTTNFDTEVDFVISDAVEILQRKQKAVGNVSRFQESVPPPNPLLNFQNSKPLEVASNHVDMFMLQDEVKVPDNVHLTADAEEEIDIRLSQMEVGSISGGDASETSSLSAPINLHLLKEQIEQASTGKVARWMLKTLDENQAVFQLKWGPWLYKCRMMVYVDQMNPKESRVSFATTSEGDELESIGYNCFKYLVSDEVVPFPVCSERIILKITDYSNIAKKIETLMRDLLRLTLSCEYTVSESLNPLRISAEVLNENLVSKFVLIFDVNLHSYPNEKIVPVVKHLMFNDIRKKVKNALASVQPGGEYYLWNMTSTADKL